MFFKPSNLANWAAHLGMTNKRKFYRKLKHWEMTLPVIEHSRRRVGVSPWYWLIIPLPAATGTGIVKVIGLWNFRLRGSIVTIGDTATLLPSSLAVNSGGIGCAWSEKQNENKKRFVKQIKKNQVFNFHPLRFLNWKYKISK